MLIASLDKKGIQKPSFLDVSTSKVPSGKTLLDNPDSDNVLLFNNYSNEDVIPTMKNEQLIIELTTLEIKEQ